jgi:hypothetical protein
MDNKAEFLAIAKKAKRIELAYNSIKVSLDF